MLCSDPETGVGHGIYSKYRSVGTITNMYVFGLYEYLTCRQMISLFFIHKKGLGFSKLIYEIISFVTSRLHICKYTCVVSKCVGQCPIHHWEQP